MVGLEVMYTVAASSISSAQDAIVCVLHWELIKDGYKCLGSGDQPSSADKASELLPVDWSSNKEVYTLRYQGNDGSTNILLKAITVDSTLIISLMVTTTNQVSELTVNTNEYVDADHLDSFDRVFKDVDGLSRKMKTQLLPSRDRPSSHKAETNRREAREEGRTETEDRDPLRIPGRHPGASSQPYRYDPLDPFAAGRADLDPFGSGVGGGMIVDPLRSGFPRSGFSPMGGIPDILPPGAVPPGARFDPFGPMGRFRPGPDRDHLPPPGSDDMFM